MNHLIRRSTAIAASPATRRALVALIMSSQQLTAAIYGDYSSMEKVGFAGLRRIREIHFSVAPLGFKATEIARAEYAVDEFFDEDKMAGKGSADEGLEIAKLGIAKEIVDHLDRRGITKLFPIQRAVLEPAMQGRDMIGRAKTGTGKTLAFGIPIMDSILQFQAKHGRGRFPLAIVLAPTRELARQVEKEFKESAPLDTICVYGGVPIQQQMRTLDYGVDVVVGTPGRVIDLLKRGALNLSKVQFVVLDEADQMLNVGFAEDVEVILEKLPPKRQSMMFSATMPSWIRKLTQRYLNDPLTIDLVGDSVQKLAEGISLFTIASDNYSKPAILGPLIKEHAKGGKCIVFTQTKRDADRLAYVMGRSIECQALHGDISQNQRERTLTGFRDGRFNVLVATDVAARGLDIPNVDLVIHYELPITSEIFVHRSGRTGRAGKKGSAILIYGQEQSRAVRGIELDVGCKFTELPKITAEGRGDDLFGSMSGGRSDSYGGGSRMGGSGFGRSGGFGGSGFSRPRGFGGSGGFGGSSYGGSDSRQSGGFGGSGFGRSGGFGSFGSDRSNSSGDSGFGSTNESSSGRFSGLGGTNSGGFGGSGISGFQSSSGFGGPSSGYSGGFGRSESNQSSGSGRGGFGSSGGSLSKDNADDSWPGRSFMNSS